VTHLFSNQHAAAETVISLRGVARTYASPAGAFSALAGVDLDVRRGEFVAVVGESGSGKSTLLNLLGGIDRPSSGDIVIDGERLNALSENALSIWRGRSIGFVFQFFQLLPTLTVAENVMLPMDFLGARPLRERRRRALELLARVGLPDRADQLPAALSGGQQQRVAIARALANDPPIVTADEPTGNLDSETAWAVIELFRTLAAAGTTVVIATHDRDLARLAGRTVALEDGRLRGAPRP
jgi:putative ABC transport system ATP-binding protein